MPFQRPLIRNYCDNDNQITAQLYRQLSEAIRLREAMSDQYGLDLRSKSDAQIAEQVIKSEYQKLTGNIQV